MARRLYTFKDGSYIPLRSPLSRVSHYSNPTPTATPAPVKKKKVLRYEDWSQRDQMEYKLDRNRRLGNYSSGKGVGP